MTTLTRTQELCDQLSTAISTEVANAPKVNKSAHKRIRGLLTELKKIATPAKQESMEVCKGA